MIHFSAKDNYSVGLGSIEDKLKEINYVYENGNFDYLNFRLINGTVSGVYGTIFNIDEEIFKEGYITSLKALPYVNDLNHFNIIETASTRFMSGNQVRYKTNREITAETTQFNLLSNENVVIWDDFYGTYSVGRNIRRATRIQVLHK